ncbi:MAG: TetR/AcrR family transcriptional regulator [Veillonella sp.]|uniref:TetR/AcrR family transcriptional regulator n=1 Tax=Veillonella sp. TaxID=1926307 RepID=UPI0025DD4CBC|nr:TetR/AcrR family transcriptional regulator [Veillonella sp.]MBS4913312.1 TetR/AcrR family transcriptional regulator [Veillonella sp.]
MKEPLMSRKEYTRYRIKHGLLELLTTAHFDVINVSKLSKASGVTRATFYLHYSNLMDVVDELLEDAILDAGDNDAAPMNLGVISGVLKRARTVEELQKAYESVYEQLPLCQRISGEPKYIPMFKDPVLAEYIINNLYLKERPHQVKSLMQELHISESLAESIFLFCVHGLYAINQRHNWQRTDEWLHAQQALFQFMWAGMKSLAK